MKSIFLLSVIAIFFIISCGDEKEYVSTLEALDMEISITENPELNQVP